MKSFLFMLMLIPLFLKTCVNPQTDKDRTPLAKVGDETIYLDEALKGMPQGLSNKDSANYVHQFVRNRARDLLVYEKALKNIPQNQELEDLVESYRRSLIIYEYQQQVMNEKLETELSETELMDFYKANPRRFAADHNLVKGVFIKISRNATDLDKIKRLYKNASADALQKIEKYCVQNAGQVDFFYDRWISFDDVMDKIPYEISNKAEFLRTRSSLEVEENEICYLLFVDDYVLSGNTAPFDYIRNNVKTVMMNTRKSDFLNRFEQALLKDAEHKKKIKYYK